MHCSSPRANDGLQDVRRIDRTLRRAGADERMKLIDKEQALAVGLDFLNDLLESLFELATVFGSCDKRSDVKRE